MEMKKPNDMAMGNKDTATNVPYTFEKFPSSWTVLQENSKDKDIISMINQLLSMYQPDDGIAAYERVLKALLALSENFNNNTQQQIISIIPLPKGASNDAIKDIIYKTTSLMKKANDMTTCQKINVPENKLDTDIFNEGSKIHLNQNILVNTSSQNLELDENFVPSIPEVFRGFPPNEISMIHSHIRNVNYMYNTLNSNTSCVEPCIDVRQNFPSNNDQQAKPSKLQSNLKLKWLHTPHLLYKNNSCQSTMPDCQENFHKRVDDKYFQLPIDKANNYNQWNVTNIPHTPYQDDICFKKKLCKNGIIPNKQDKIMTSDLGVTSNSSFSKSGMNNCESLHNEDVNYDFKKYNSNICENKIINMETQKRFMQEMKIEQAIQQDIYKMDVVCWNENKNNPTINIQVPNEDHFLMDNFTVHKKLGTSLQKFLKRAEQEILIEFPVLPQTRSLYTVPLRTKCWEFVTQKDLKNNNQLDFSIKNTSCPKNANAQQNVKKLIEKKVSRLLNIYPKRAQMLPNSLNTAPSKVQAVECEKKDNIENLPYKSAVKQTEQSSVNILQQSASITELATFKKQYYDTLLNIQKAKVAVANSLAISSVESSTKYDPYYSSHSYQQQQLLQQHAELSVSPQFSVHTMAQSGLSNMHNTSYTWVRYNDWRHPRLRQLRFPRQSPFQQSRNKE